MGVLTLETNKYAIKLENFEGPLDLLCHLIDKNKMDISKVNISEITEQYIAYINQIEEEKLEIASEFLVMASTLVLLKSKSLLPKEVEDEAELTEEELIRRIIEYKKYKEISKELRNRYEKFSKILEKFPDTIELPKQALERNYESSIIVEKYRSLVEKNEQKINQNAKNIEKIAITETFTVASKVKQIFRELTKKPRFVFNKLFTLQKCSKNEVVTAFSGLLELSRRSKVTATQEITFGDITVEKLKSEVRNQRSDETFFKIKYD